MSSPQRPMPHLTSSMVSPAMNGRMRGSRYDQDKDTPTNGSRHDEVAPSRCPGGDLGRFRHDGVAAIEGAVPVRPVVAPPEAEGRAPGRRPTFSVVIPAYQAADVIGQAVSSALGQTAPPYEVVVCDDGSTDAIDEALEPFGQRVVVVRKANGGGASALNAAVGAASGDFVSWLDADDAYEPERLEAIGDLAVQRPDIDILMTDSYLEAGGKVVGRFCAETPFTADDQRLAILDRCFIAWPAVRRSQVLGVGGFDESLRIAYDWDFWMRLLFAGARAGLVDVPLHRYRISDQSLSGARSAALRERVLVLEKALGTLDLSGREREVAMRSLRQKQSRALVTEAEAAIRGGVSGRRRKALSVALSPGFALPTRARAAMAALSPRLAAGRLERIEARTGRSRLKRSLPRR